MTTSSAVARRGEYRALALMYMAQGLPVGLAFNALGVLIRQGGHSVADVGLTGLAFLPWAFKFLWAGPMDNACARWGYGRVVAVTQALAVALCLLLVPISPQTQLYACLAVIMLLNAVCATQDIATNAYAVSRLQGRTAGAANAIQAVGFIVGTLLGGGGLLVVHDHWGWAGAMQTLAAMMAALYLPLLLDRGWLRGGPGRRVIAKVRLRDLLEHDDLAWMLGVALSFKFASTAISILIQPWLVDRGLTLTQVGTLQMVSLLAGALGGLLLGMPLVARLGSRRAVRVVCVWAALVLGIAFGLNAWGLSAPGLLYAAFAVESVFEGALFVAIAALFMNWASPKRPGTDYTVMQCCESLANTAAAGAIGGLGHKLGYGPAFGLTWVVGVLLCGLILLAVRRVRLQGEAGEP